MKIRNGFVSNSSSSSFIVVVKDMLDINQGIVTDEQMEKLLDYGFRFTDFYNPCHIEWNDKWEADKETDILAISVVCNEDDVMYFLIENDISFDGLTHYGYYSKKWDGKNKVKHIRNPGIEMSMLPDELYDTDELIYEEFTKEEWLNLYGQEK